jgi:hypothetical protein
MGSTALLPARRKSCYGFLSLLKIHRPWPSFNPRTLGPIASTITTRPPRTTWHLPNIKGPAGRKFDKTRLAHAWLRATFQNNISPLYAQLEECVCTVPFILPDLSFVGASWVWASSHSDIASQRGVQVNCVAAMDTWSFERTPPFWPVNTWMPSRCTHRPVTRWAQITRRCECRC